ncbi:tetratricopeptide repeat protein [Solirubrobacter soli]|uniref:tetratricopeptide repeat protein n=1 Tax=Solirubrobacter soli TaxID=363832 RepID=UPI0004194F2C|nr:hypothetical protein [Solirubrobacter soli]
MTAEREPLDLAVHDPEQWEGKYIDVGGARYTIGHEIGAGSSKIVHRLVNDRSGLLELALKIWRDPSAAGPGGAESVRRLYGSLGMSTTIPSEVTFWAHGGCLQLQEFFGNSNTNPVVSKLLDDALELLLSAQAVEPRGGGQLKLSRARAPFRRQTLGTLSLVDLEWGDPAGNRLDEYRTNNFESGGRPLRSLTRRLRERLGGTSVLAQAMACYQAVLRENPEHSEALHNAAGICAVAGDIEQATDLETRVVVIEPNYLPYLQACTYYASAAGLPRRALLAFEQARHKFPYDHDQDGLACEAYLQCGEPERAAELLDAAVAAADEALRGSVAAAVRGHEAARELLVLGCRGLDEGDTGASRRAVEQASRQAPADLLVRATMALFTRADGDPAAALDELLRVHDLARPGLDMHCLSTAAAIALEIGDLAQAAHLLDRAWRLMQAYHDDASPIDPDWIPGIAEFFSPDGVFERPMSAMAELLENAVQGRGAEAPAQLIEAYAARYWEAAALTE